VVPVLRYGLIRLLLFGAVLAVLWWAGARGLLLILLAGGCSAALSFVLLRGSRHAAVEALAQRTRRPRRVPGLQAGIERDAAIEDAAVDAGAGPGSARQSGQSARPSPNSAP
jgi:hypothetical protein